MTSQSVSPSVPTTQSVVVRVSRASFDPAAADEWERRLAGSGQALVPAIKKLKGLMHYYAGIDKTAGSLMNISVWDSIESAKQMEILPEMAVAGREFIAAGAVFERPIVNYSTVWTI